MKYLDMRKEMAWINYIHELRRRLIICALLIILLFVAFFVFYPSVFQYVAFPLLKNLPVGGRLIAIGVSSPFLVPVKLSFILALLLAMPFLLYQLWAFIAPALYTREQRLVFPFILLSVTLFYIGVLFAYYLFLPLVFRFLIAMAPPHVTIMTDISHYIDFVSRFIFAFGVAFQVPVFVLLSIHSGFTTLKKLKTWRPYVIVIAFVLGMLLTPPDVISQTLLALPIWLLFESGLAAAWLLQRKKPRIKKPC